MAEGKKAFILYADQKETFDQLPDEVAGKLIKHIYAYVNDENPESDDVLLNIAFTPIKQALKRDLRKYESIIQRNRENGKKGGRPKKDEPKKPSGLSGNPKEPKKADKDNDSVNDNVIYILKKDCFLQFESLEKRFKSRISKFDHAIKQWELNIISKGEEGKTSKQLIASLEKWLGTWLENESKEPVKKEDVGKKLPNNRENFEWEEK